MIIDRATFTQKVGREPVLDDLERVNCPRVGKPGHYQCGWCPQHDQPRFVCGCLASETGAAT